MTLPSDILRSGKNTITVRLCQPFANAQVLGNKEQFYIQGKDHTFFKNIVTEWKYNDQIESAVSGTESYQCHSAFLLNGMVAPVIPYAIKGFILYQGEANVGDPFLYEKMFRQLIID